MGVPNYGPDLAKELRELRLSVGRVWTAVSSVQKDGRPWSPMTVSDVSSSRWPSTTSASFTSLQEAGGTRSHPSLGYLLKISAPAAGSEWRVIDEASNILVPATSAASGVTSVSGTFSAPSGLDYYEPFQVFFQARSITAGQTTAISLGRIYGRA